jgi:uncharacterized protein YjbI with pentapeptide repeats
MLSRRNREPPPSRTELASFAARAKDLGALRDAVVDAAGVGTGLWLSYLFVLFYFAIAAGAVTHRDLLLENPVKLPFLNVELPRKAFFVLGPLVFLIVHAYVLLHFVLLAGKIGAFDVELEAQIGRDDAKAQLRRQLPSNIFVQFLAGPREVRTGIIGFLLKAVAWISLIIGPIALLVLFQLQFLPYHKEWITLWQRIAVVIDLVLLWILWPPIVRGETNCLAWRDFKRIKIRAWLPVSILPVLLVFTIATFPGEWLENLPPVPIIPTTWEAWTLPSVQAIQMAGSGWATLHETLVAGQVNYVTGRPQSLWSNRLVLPNFDIGDRVKFDAEGKIAISSDSTSLRGRSLEGAVFVNAHLKKADFTGANLAGANFVLADLREAKFECDTVGDELICAQLHDANLTGAQLQGASLIKANLQRALLRDAQLQGASLDGAYLQKASLVDAQLQGSSLEGAQLQGDYFGSTPLQGATLDDAQLQGAVLPEAQLKGASLVNAQLQGATLADAQLQGTSLDRAQLRGANLYGAQLEGASLVDANLQGAWLQEAQLQGAWLSGAQLRGADLRSVYVWRTEAPSHQNGEGALVVAPESGPKYSGLDCPDKRAPCDWSAASFAALKSLITNTVPAGLLRDQALRRIAPLEKPPFVEDEAAAKAWAALAEISARSPQVYWDAVTTTLREIGCDPSGAPDVVLQLIAHLYFRFKNNPAEAAGLATAFLDEAHCPGARGLGMEKGKLQMLLH